MSDERKINTEKSNGSVEQENNNFFTRNKPKIIIGIVIISILIISIPIIIKIIKKICIGKKCCESIEYCYGNECCNGKNCCEICESIEYCYGNECCNGKNCCEICESKEFCEDDECCNGKNCCEICENIEKCDFEGCCNEKDCCIEENCRSIKQCNYKGCCNGNYCCVENTGIIIDINQKINYTNIYEDVINKNLNIEVNKVGKNRRLEEKNFYTEIKGEYLLNVYDFKKKDNSSIVYYAYAVLLNLNKKNNEINVFIGGNDIRNYDSKEFPFIKFNFDENGLISNLQVENNYNSTLIAYIYEFINKIIPKLDKKLYEESNNNSIKYSYQNNSNEKCVLYKTENEPISYINGSNNVKNMAINIINNEVKEVTNVKDSSIRISNSFESENLDHTFFNETEGNNLATRNPPINGYSEKIESVLTLQSSYEDNSLTNKIIEIINSKNLINYSNNLESNSRLLNSNNSNENKLRKIDEISPEPFNQPFIFIYPLFNIDFLGVKIGLFSKIAFLPLIGELKLEIFYNKNGNLESISNQTIITNFDTIIDEIQEVINQLIQSIEQFVVYIRENNFNETEKNLNIQLETLFQKIETPPDLSDTFKTVEDFFHTIISLSATCYNNANELANNTLYYFNNILKNINEGNQSNLIKIISITKNDVINFINDHQSDANNIYEASKIFYPEIEEKIKNRLVEKQNYNDYTPFNFDIATFYDIQDTYKKVLKILSGFKTRIENAIAVENITFYNEVQNQFEEILNSPLEDVEFISYNARNNASVIDAMRIFWGEEEGDKNRKLLIDNINSLRVKINDMINAIFNKITSTHKSELLNSETFKNIIDNLQNYVNEVESNQTSLMNYLKTFIHYDLNFNIYVEDVKALLSVNYAAMKAREESYKKFIIERLNNIEDTYTNQNFLDNINSTLFNILIKIIESTKKRNYGYALGNCSLIENEVNNIINNSLSRNLLNKIIEIYTDDNLLNDMIRNYYFIVIPAFEEFNYTFFNKHFLVHANQYVSKPTELITKLGKIILSQEEEKKSQITNLNNLLILSINNAIENSYNKVYQTVKSIKAEFNSKAPKNKYGEYGNYRAKYEEIEEKLDEILNLFFDRKGKMKILYKYIKKNDDEFSLSSKGINLSEEQIISNLQKIYNEMNLHFQYYICKDNNELCKNGNLVVLSEMDQYNYQIAKLRDSVNQLNNLIPIAETMMENSLSNLDSNKFLNLYSKYNYYSFDIASDLKNYLYLIRQKTDELMDPYIEKTKNDIKNIFNEKLNMKGINASITNIALKIFSKPSSLMNDLKKYLESICGPKNKIIDLFTEEKKYYYYKNGYMFNYKSYDDNFKQLKNEIENNYNLFIQDILSNIKGNSILKNKIKDEYNNIINDAYNNLKDKINIISTFQNFKFLDHEYIFDTFINDALTEISNDLKLNTWTSINNIYDNYLSDLKQKLNQTFKEVFDENFNWLSFQYNSTISDLQKLKGTKKNITEISIYKELIKVFNDMFKKIIGIYSNDNLNDIFNKIQNEEIDDLNLPVEFNDFVSNLRNDINTFQEEARKRLINEKLEFTSNIESIFFKGYNRTISDFLNGAGINEINYIYNEDYISTINNKFRYFKEEINNIKDYMITLLESEDVISISKKLSETLKNIYITINYEFKQIIPIQINDIIFNKISIFEDEVLSLIPDKFMNNLIKELKSSDFNVRIGNELILNLIPKSFPESFKTNLTNYFKEMLNNLSLNQFKNNYDYQINQDLNEISSLLLEYQNLIFKKVSTKSQSSTSLDMIQVIEVYENYLNVVENYNTIFEFEINENKVKEIKKFFNDSILYYIKNIKYGFDEKVNDMEKIINLLIDNFDNNNNILKEVQIKLENTNISKIVENVYNNLSFTMNMLSHDIGNEFDIKMRNEIQNKYENISLIGFTERKEKRNLNQYYNLNKINSYIKFIENAYKEFNNSILQNTNFIGIRTKEGNFINVLMNSYIHMDDYFNKYEYLTKENSQLKRFSEIYKTKSLEVQKSIQIFLTEQVSKIDNTVNVIQNTVKNDWYHIKNVINTSIKTGLDYVFKKLLKEIKPLSEENIPFNDLISKLEPIKVFDEYEQSVFTVNLETISNNLKYSYYMKCIEKNNMFEFDIDVHTSGNIELIISTEINNLYKGTIKGILGSGTIGIRPHYYLQDKSVEVNAYVKSESSSYVSLFEQFNFYSMKYEIDEEEEIEVISNQDLNITKVFRHGN